MAVIEFDMCCSPYITRNKYGDIVPVPCGKCYECLEQWTKDWRFRLNAEKRHSFASMYLTLTYNDAHLPVKYNDEVGEWQSFVDKKELQDFFKRVRFHAPGVKFRYFAVGEYGGDYNRCHYHILFFFSHTQGLSRNQFYMLFRYCWQGRGFIYLKATEQRHINYVSGYFNKIDTDKHITKPFKLMSKSIGLCYLTHRMVEYFFTHFKRGLPNPFGKGYVKLPRYYVKKLDEMTSVVAPESYGNVWSDIVNMYPFKPRTDREKKINRYLNGILSTFDVMSKEMTKHGDGISQSELNYIFNEWAKCVPEIVNSRASSMRMIEKCRVHHKYTKLSDEIKYLYGTDDS